MARIYPCIVIRGHPRAALLLLASLVLLLPTTLALHQFCSIECVDVVAILRVQGVVVAQVVSAGAFNIVLHKAAAGLVYFQKFLAAEFVLEFLQLFHLLIVLKHLLSLGVYRGQWLRLEPKLLYQMLSQHLGWLSIRDWCLRMDVHVGCKRDLARVLLQHMIAFETVSIAHMCPVCHCGRALIRVGRFDRRRETPMGHRLLLGLRFKRVVLVKRPTFVVRPDGLVLALLYIDRVTCYLLSLRA